MGAVEEILEKMREQRRHTNDRLQRVTEEQMLATATYGERKIDVRFMFYRYIAHEVEHTVQLAKTFQMLGISQSEAQRILKALQAARGELEGMLVGLSDDDLDRKPAEGEWSAREVIEHIIDVEEWYGKRIDAAIEDAAS